MVSISVSDSGLGISEENLSHMFQPFNRLGFERSAIEGTGVGLVITRKLIEAMGGSIKVQSEVGTGSTFTVLVPASNRALAQADADAPSEIEGGGQVSRLRAAAQDVVVLYIEDNPSNQIVMQKVIARLPSWKLLIADDGEAGLIAARRDEPDIILMDINLPGMSGYEALARLQNMPETATTPVVAISANAMPVDVARGKAAGFFDYLTKPIDIGAMLDAISSAVENKP